MSIGYIVECKGYIRVECACICDTTHSIVQCKSEKCERAFCPSDDNIYVVINIATVILVIMHASMQYRESQLIISACSKNFSLLHGECDCCSFFPVPFLVSVYRKRMPQPCSNVQWSSHSAALDCLSQLDSCWLQ